MTQNLIGRARPHNLPREDALARPVRPRTTTYRSKGVPVNYRSQSAQQAEEALTHYARWLHSLNELLRLGRLDKTEFNREYATVMYGMATQHRLLDRPGEAARCTELARLASATILDDEEGQPDE